MGREFVNPRRAALLGSGTGLASDRRRSRDARGLFRARSCGRREGRRYFAWERQTDIVEIIWRKKTVGTEKK